MIDRKKGITDESLEGSGEGGAHVRVHSRDKVRLKYSSSLFIYISPCLHDHSSLMFGSNLKIGFSECLVCVLLESLARLTGKGRLLRSGQLALDSH